jgi:hypothetical protein
MKADGKSTKGGSDQDDKEDFGEASGRSNGGPRKKIRGPFWKGQFLGGKGTILRGDRRIGRMKHTL